MKFYFTTQGGEFSKANQVYFWPVLTLTQQQDGFDIGDGEQRHWVLACFFLFWAVGVMW